MRAGTKLGIYVVALMAVFTCAWVVGSTVKGAKPDQSLAKAGISLMPSQVPPAGQDFRHVPPDVPAISEAPPLSAGTRVDSSNNRNSEGLLSQRSRPTGTAQKPAPPVPPVSPPPNPPPPPNQGPVEPQPPSAPLCASGSLICAAVHFISTQSGIPGA